MLRHCFKLSVIAVLYTVTLPANALSNNDLVNIFACEPEWQALAQELGGDKLNVYSATNALQDPHHIQARPSLIVKMRRTDLVICTGAGLEDAWLSLLIRQASNTKLSQEPDRIIYSAQFVERLEIPTKIDRSLGDIHGEGNPHLHLDPHKLFIIAQLFSERLKQFDAKNADFYNQQFKQFAKQWQENIDRWESVATALKDKKAVVYHRNWSYLINWLGMTEVADLEPIPGVPPSAKHLASLLKKVDEQAVDFILVAPYQDDKGARWLSKKSGIPLITLPFTVGGDKHSSNLEELFTRTLTLLIQPES